MTTTKLQMVKWTAITTITTTRKATATRPTTTKTIPTQNRNTANAYNNDGKHKIRCTMPADSSHGTTNWKARY